MPSHAEPTNTLIDDLGTLSHHADGIFTQLDIRHWEITDDTARELIGRIQTFLRGSKMQALLFAIIFSKGIGGRRTDIDDLAKHLGTEGYRMLNFIPQLNELVRRGVLFETTRYDEIGYRVTEEAMKAILNNETELKDRFQNLGQEQLIEEFSRLLRLCDRDDINATELRHLVTSLLENNAGLALCTKMTELALSYEEKCLVLSLIVEILSDDTGVDLSGFINKLCSRLAERTKLKMMFIKGQSVLQQKDYVCFEKGGVFHSDRMLKMTDSGSAFFLGEQAILLESKIKTENVTIIPAAEISPKTLFFNPETEKAFHKLAGLMKPNQMTLITERLRSKQMPEGFCALFYGGPGTGKTESVLQLAAQSGRTVMMVNIADIRDKYVGESEKRLAQVFRSYEKVRKNSELAPILFFNEADALIGKRISVQNAVDQMNNSMQNILLQQLEQFKGLFLATTNLAEHLDNAFERRFLYKIKFELPDIQSRAKIWKSKLDGLTDDEYVKLATDFTLSGGQIENVARKAEIDFILEGGSISHERISRYAAEERLESRDSRPRIGYKGAA